MSLRQKYRRPPASVKQEQDDDSDAEEPHPGPRRAEGPESQIIHSGHFMVSSPHSEHPPKKGYDFDTVNKQTCQTYRFGKASTSHFSIDASLTKLFECMTLAYSGKLVSPKWKNFKGLKLLWRDKIRLNNAIWRAWYMQYVEKRENPVCHFVTPLDGSMDLDVHRPLQKHKDDDLSSLLKDEETAARRVTRRLNETPAPMEMDTLFDMDVLMSEFSDTLFSTLASHQPIAWPNPREIAHAGNADMIQPGLIPLQPNLDFMDSFDPLQGHTNAVIVTPTPLKADAVPNTGVVISSSHLAGAPGFHVVSQAQKPNVSRQKSCSSSRKNQKASSSVGHSQPGPGQGTTCVLDQIPSPQSLISSSTALVKNEQNQSRRTTHISAEQKRRSNINIGFKTLCSLVPTLKSQSNITNAVTLQKTVDHIGKLQQERQQMQEEVRRLREEIDELNTSINFCQEQLPATGVPVRRHQLSHMQEKFNEYVKCRTLQNWKFWIFSIIIKPLFESFNGMVSTTSRAELCQTTLQWLDRHCSLPVLRPTEATAASVRTSSSYIAAEVWEALLLEPCPGLTCWDADCMMDLTSSSHQSAGCLCNEQHLKMGLYR
ncbi:hypothetical protein F2P81_013968 [Scophthalmus maximus]|uniref:BHLH domain-containing protein n=1 Tax=Scophthalmus maximus TaxID=52904 RepID=A0A6A4SUZ6_SCOMX|nr:hypothetical protein F2P81_013968 [Scophthalmus maximus]